MRPGWEVKTSTPVSGRWNKLGPVRLATVFLTDIRLALRHGDQIWPTRGKVPIQARAARKRAPSARPVDGYCGARIDRYSSPGRLLNI